MSFVNEGGLRGQSWNNHAHVAEELGKAIVAGEYPPGAMIPLDPDICEMFGVSRTVVREAKKTLAAKGFVQSKAKVGTHVRPKAEWNMFDIDVLRWHAALKDNAPFLKDLFEIRLIVEPNAAAQVAGNLSDDHNVLLGQLSERFARVGNNASEFVLLDLEFHQTILRMTGNSFLTSMGDLVQTSLHSVFERAAPRLEGEELKELIENDRDVVQAVRDGDQSSAHALMALVIRKSQASLAA